MRKVTTNEIIQAVEEVNGGWAYKDDRAYSSHPGDWYLRIVLAERTWASGTKEYTTWLYNATLGGLANGRYTFTEATALKDFEER